MARGSSLANFHQSPGFEQVALVANHEALSRGFYFAQLSANGSNKKQETCSARGLILGNCKVPNKHFPFRKENDFLSDPVFGLFCLAAIKPFGPSRATLRPDTAHVHKPSVHKDRIGIVEKSKQTNSKASHSYPTGPPFRLEKISTLRMGARRQKVPVPRDDLLHGHCGRPQFTPKQLGPRAGEWKKMGPSF